MMFSVDLESWEGTTLQEISGLSALSRALTLPPPREKKHLAVCFQCCRVCGELLAPIRFNGSSVPASAGLPGTGDFSEQ